MTIFNNVADITSITMKFNEEKQPNGTITNYSINYNKKTFFVETIKTSTTLLKLKLDSAEVITQLSHDLNTGKITNLSTKMFDLTQKNVEEYINNDKMLYYRYEYSFVAINNDNIYMTEKQKKDLFPYLLSCEEEKEVK